jgi:hypothetical protein
LSSPLASSKAISEAARSILWDALRAAANLGEHLPEGSSRCVDIDGRPGHVRQERVEDHVVLRVEKENLTLGRGKLAAQGLRELHGGKSASDNDDSCRCHCLCSRFKDSSLSLFWMRSRVLRMKEKYRLGSKSKYSASASQVHGLPDIWNC